MKLQTTLFLTTSIIVTLGVGFLLWQQPPAYQPAQSVSTSTTESATSDSSSPADKSLAQPVQPVIKAEILRFAPQHGETLALSFNSSSDGQMDFSFIVPAISGSSAPVAAPQQQNKSPLLMQASGELHLKYYSHPSGNWQVAAWLADQQVLINGKQPVYADALTHPFAFRMSETGFLSGFRFTRGVPTEAQQFVQQLLYSLQVAFPEQAKSTWSTEELDMAGRYRSDYILSGIDAATATISKQKREYFALNLAEQEISPALSRSQIEIGQSQTTVTIPLHGAWLLTLEQTETTQSKSAGYVWAESSNRLAAQRIERDLAARFPQTFDEFLTQIDDDRYLKTKYYLTDPELNRLGENLDTNGALRLFDQLKNSAMQQAARNAEKFLVNYLRQYPQAAFELVDLLDDDPRRERFDQSTHLALWRLLTEAGHAEAQQALVGALMDANRSRVTHMRALAYLSDFEFPESSTTQALWGFYQGLEMAQDKISQEYRTMSLFALGSLANADKLNQSVKPEISKILIDNLHNATQPHDQEVTLGAIGNYGGAEVLDEIQPYFTLDDEKVRIAAYGALRHIEDPQAVSMLTTHYPDEESPAVRARAARTLSQMKPTAEGVAWASSTLLKIDAVKEQLPLVEVLGKSLDQFPTNESGLRALLKQNPDNRVKREIYKYIVPVSQ